MNDPGKRGWVHLNLLKMTAEARAAAKKAAAQKEQQAAAAAQKERAYVDSLPKLVSEGSTVVIATSIDCAKDLQNVIGFGRKNGTGVEYRKKMLELVTLGCAMTMDNGTVLLHAAKNGDFVAFTAYKSGKQGVALKENVRWP